MEQPAESNWPKIILAVKSPLGLAALLMLVLGAILLVLAPRIERTDLTILVVGILLLLVLSVVLAFAAGTRLVPTNPEFVLRTEVAKPLLAPRYDVFLSAPMAALGDKEYEEVRTFCLAVKRMLVDDCNMTSVFYAADDIQTKDSFDPHDSAVLEDFRAIGESRYFVLLLPKRTASSVLFEAGVALALGKNCIYLVKQRSNLPFLMQQAELAFDNVKIYEYAGLPEIRRLLSAENTFSFAS